MRTIIALILAALSVPATLAQNPDFPPSRKVGYAEALIENFYVDDVNGDSIANEAIIAMLKTLDPHSAYSSPEETKALNEPLEGKFSGIGVQFNMSTDTVYVIQTISGGPSEKVGILPGDRIIQADDSVIAGRKLPNSSIIKILRGPKGSKVNLKVLRPGVAAPIDFLVIRDDIPMNSVDAAYMVDPLTGYISLSRFAEDSPNEVADAIRKLKKQGMQRLILDLESNGGGYLGSAVGLASLFLKNGDNVVYTNGRSFRPEYYNASNGGHPLFDGPVVVMVDQYSASASEILSGALQDHDRGVVVGRRTFGKGLVQRPFPFPDGSMIRLTVSRYYTPTGRSIQKHYEKGKGEEYQLDLLTRYQSGELWSADSIRFDEHQKFKTLHSGRTVYGGGGIMPDVFVPVDTTLYSAYYRDLVAKGAIAQYCIQYVDRNRADLLKKYPTEDAFSRDFKVSQEMIDDVVAKGVDTGVEHNPEQLLTSRPMVEAVIKGLLERDLYEDGAYVRATNPLNPVYNKALEIISDPGLYNSILSTAR